MLGVTRDIAVEFGVPVVGVGSRTIRVVTAGMLMPKAAMNKDHFASAGENNIRLAGQVLSVQAVTKAPSMEQSPNRHLNACITRLNCPHDLAAFGGVEAIHTSFIPC